MGEADEEEEEEEEEDSLFVLQGDAPEEQAVRLKSSEIKGDVAEGTSASIQRGSASAAGGLVTELECRWGIVRSARHHHDMQEEDLFCKGSLLVAVTALVFSIPPLAGSQKWQQLGRASRLTATC